MAFTDMHIHLLFGADDGAGTEAEMYALLDASYADGVRTLCCTPHFHPGYFGDNRKQIEEAFSRLACYTQDNYSDLKLYLGNELRYSRNCLDWLNAGDCRTLGGTHYVLVDFLEDVKETEIVRGMEQLLSGGYRPVLAHTERYRNLRLRSVELLRENGVRIQMDTQSVTGGFGLAAKSRSRKLLAKGFADMVSSDAHDCLYRPPGLSECYGYISRHWGSGCADALCETNALHLFEDAEGKDSE